MAGGPKEYKGTLPADSREQAAFDIQHRLCHGVQPTKNNVFLSNVRHSLRLRGFTTANNTIPDSDADKISLLRQCLLEGHVVRKNRNALKIDETSRPTRYANPGVCVPCHLHAKKREGEKLLKEILLAGMHRLEPGKLDLCIAYADMIINEDILHRLTIHQMGEDGQWVFSIDETTKNERHTFIKPYFSENS